MPQITIDIDKDTLAALALGAMADGVTVNNYVTIALAELAKVVEEQITNPLPELDEAVGEITDEPPPPQAVDNNNIGTAPSPDHAGGEGAPLYNKRDTKWTI